jgi:LysM repeat protein
MSNSKLQYLTIVGYKDNAFGSKIGAYRALINPDKYTHSYEIAYNQEQGIGTPNASIKYQKSSPQGLNFELIFDGTGVLNSSRTDVAADITNFKKIAYDYNGDIHKPNYLKLIWGKGINFRCQLTSLNVNYSMFRSDGSPLRARATVDFKEYLNPTQVTANAANSSPDLTHEWLVKAGDTLPAITSQIYGDSSYYLKVATYNNLDNFRYLKPGTTLYLPPLI